MHVVDGVTDIGPILGNTSAVGNNQILKTNNSIGQEVVSSLTDSGTVLATTDTSMTGAATNTAFSLQAGVDATTQASTAALTLRGEDVTGGSTVTLTGGALTLRGGNNASTGNTNIGGAVTINGGNATGGTGTSDAGGAVSATGGNCTATTGGCTPGTFTATAGGFTAAFTNGAGSDAVLAAGLGTGNATAAHFKLKSPALSQTSGTTAQTQVTRFVTTVKAGSTTTATNTGILTIPIAANQTVGMTVFIHVETTQATPQNCSTEEDFHMAAQNTGGTITQQTTATTGLGTICSTGTLTIVPAFTTASSPITLNVAPAWTVIVPVTVTITVTIINNSQQDITLL